MKSLDLRLLIYVQQIRDMPIIQMMGNTLVPVSYTHLCIVKKKAKKLILKNKFAVKVQVGKKFVNLANK